MFTLGIILAFCLGCLVGWAWTRQFTYKIIRKETLAHSNASSSARPLHFSSSVAKVFDPLSNAHVRLIYPGEKDPQ